MFDLQPLRHNSTLPRAVKLSGRGREEGYPYPPAQIRAYGFPVPGSYRRSAVILPSDSETFRL